MIRVQSQRKRRGSKMKSKKKILDQPTRLSELSFDGLFEDDASDSWELKAERLLARRIRKFKREMI